MLKETMTVEQLREILLCMDGDRQVWITGGEMDQPVTRDMIDADYNFKGNFPRFVIKLSE